jgi:hypothetical protein
LDSYGLSLSDVAKVLSAANVIEAVGRMEDHYKLYLAMSDTRRRGIDQIRGTIIRSGPGGLVRLDNVATISEGTSPQWIRVTADGHDAVIFQVHQQPGGNTSSDPWEIKAKLAGFQKQLSSDIKIANWYDQSELILSSEKSVRIRSLGVVFAILILLLFCATSRSHTYRRHRGAGGAGRHCSLLYVCQMSFNISDTGRNGAAVDSSSMTPSSWWNTSCVACAKLPGSPRAGSARGVRVYQIPCRLIGFHNHHFCSLGFSLRCDRRLF